LTKKENITNNRNQDDKDNNNNSGDDRSGGSVVDVLEDDKQRRFLQFHGLEKMTSEELKKRLMDGYEDLIEKVILFPFKIYGKIRGIIMDFEEMKKKEKK
jgi:hypothetical protein